MNIRDMFFKEIDRDIKGVIKVGQSDDENIFQELDVDWKGDRNRPVLTVRKKDGSKVLSIPVIDYALLVKGKYNREMSNQEYLDRQDEYNMTFFLDADHKWLSASVIINSWRVVLDNVDL